MATIDLGRLGFVNKGTYNNSTTYEKNDLVQFTDGGVLSTYLYIDSTAQSGQAPSSSGTVGSRWVFFAKGVADAVAGAGNNKVLVTDGSGNLSPLSIGSASQALKVNSSANGFEFGAAGGILQYVETVYTTANKVNQSAGAVNVDAPSTLGDGTFKITIQNASSSLKILWKIHAGHNTTWTQQFSRLQYKNGSGGSWTHLDGLGSTAYQNSHAMTGNTVFSEVRHLHGQSVGTEIFFKIQTNFSHSGNYMRWNHQDPSDSASDPTATNEGTYARSFIGVYEQL